MIEVYYDGQCGLCSKEINYYKSIAPEGLFDWQDITQTDDGLEKHNIRLSDALRLLHAQDHNGSLHIGVDAFILIWRNMPYWRLLGWFANLSIIKPIASFAYEKFAAWRFSRLTHCQIALQNEFDRA